METVDGVHLQNSDLPHLLSQIGRKLPHLV